MNRLTPEEYHVPVMLNECINFLNVKVGGLYIDATMGGGGHLVKLLDVTRRELKSSSFPKGETTEIIGFDADEVAYHHCVNRFEKELAQDESGVRLQLVNANFDTIPDVVMNNKAIDGILFDLGVSSFQFDHHERGFSFRMEAPLDMRFSPQGETAADVLNTRSEQQLTNIFRSNADEPAAYKLAQVIVKRRVLAPFNRITDLRDVVAQVIPTQFQPKTMARLFQALRIEVNHELLRLNDTLTRIIPMLSIGGRVVIMSYHSGEDRIVKDTFKRFALKGTSPHLSILTKKPISPSSDEIVRNPRARSARLRCAERIA